MFLDGEFGSSEVFRLRVSLKRQSQRKARILQQRAQVFGVPTPPPGSSTSGAAAYPSSPSTHISSHNTPLPMFEPSNTSPSEGEKEANFIICCA
ncbi:hypothetical protein Acr_00g0022800 [Actinidia rufa]|uniref:Uncharacterized protein n=1 Tax=Actinidia rufa TaxID=165716 RepID=A0A7J0DCU6_9ERIC|nr:hypothetical protein Acr_00g0022800 [Actinidia rufa]